MKTGKEKWIHFLNHFEVYIGAVLFIGMMCLLFLQVVTRYVMGKSFTWTEEVGTILFIWLVYLGSCAAVLEGKHLRIDLFLSMIHGRLKKAVLIFGNLVTIFFCCYVIFPLNKIIETLARRGSVTPLLRFPNWVAYSIMPVCMILMVIRLVQDIFRIIRTEDIDRAVEQSHKSVFDTEEGGEV